MLSFSHGHPNITHRDTACAFTQRRRILLGPRPPPPHRPAQTMPLQNVAHRALRGTIAKALQLHVNLGRTPQWPPRLKLQNPLLHLSGDRSGLVMGNSRLIFEPFPSFLLIALDPFKRCLAAHTPSPCQFAHAITTTQILTNQNRPFIHYTSRFPRHDSNCNLCAWEFLLPMCLNIHRHRLGARINAPPIALLAITVRRRDAAETRSRGRLCYN